MDKSRRDLESLVVSQKEKLTRYDTRLKDVVTAYKGLLKEKEALEASLAALSSAKDSSETKELKKTNESSSATTSSINNKNVESSSDNLQFQIATLMNSLATLSAEKSRMEASFQADKKQLRAECTQKDKTIKELQEKNKELTKQNAIDVENMKSKIIIERHEREKESNDHMVMIRELQKLYSDERHLKENLEMQLNSLKVQISSTEDVDNKIKQLSTELKEAKEKLKQQYENQKDNYSSVENSSILLQLQNEMQHMKKQHAIAIKTEQKRAYVAEERNKKLAALHEDRVANLEARLAELSSTVGTYDRLRQQDQENIQKLKDKIIQLASSDEDTAPTEQPKRKDLMQIVDEITQLKKILLIENARSSNPIDFNKIFNTGTDHSQCLEDFNKVQTDLDSMRAENIESKNLIEVQKNHIKTLQEKIKVLNRNIDEQELELKSQTDQVNQAVKTEKSKWKDKFSTLENDYRGKLNSLEHQLQKQRVRSLQLLDEKENEIRALKTSFEIFAPKQLQPQHITAVQENNEDENTGKHRKSSTSHLNTILNSCGNGNTSTSNSSVSENCHMLHYAHELARKDVEISSLRKGKHSAETALRQVLQDKVSSQEELNDKIMKLEEQVDRWERCKTREGANLEYLKNVILSYLSSTDVDGKKHMINAIGAVLQFTPSEMKVINKIIQKK